MNLSCTHCGNVFTITAEQLGTRGKCPHCKATIILPKAAVNVVVDDELKVPSLWMERWFSMLGALSLHILVIAILALIPYRFLSIGEMNSGDEVFIGQINRIALTNTADSTLENQAVQLDSEQRAVNLFSDEMISPSSSSSSLSSSSTFDDPVINPGGGQQGEFDMESLRDTNQDEVGAQEFEQLVAQMKQNGLEIVITFDSTGSMEGEIQEVKNKIERMGSVLFRIIPKTRISVCTYRDVGARYVVKGLPLTDNLGDVVNFLEDVSAAGGGDDPEAVNMGLEWAIHQNQFREKARKVILLFGDAPPHAADKDYCLRMASQFRRKFDGIVSTVTCHSEQRLPSFIEIAQMGGGEAFLTRNEREIMSQLIILVFGSKHRGKVIEAFNLLAR